MKRRSAAERAAALRRVHRVTAAIAKIVVANRPKRRKRQCQK